MALPAVVVPDAPAESSDWPYRFEWVDLSTLDIGEYQRPLSSFVLEIERKFDRRLFGTLHVSQRDKKLYVIDGQTRAEAARRLALTIVPALVFTGLTLEQEADLFVHIQDDRRGVTAADRFRATVIRKDPDAVGMMEVMEGLGFFPHATSNEPGALRAMGAVAFVWRGAKRGGATVGHPELLALTLETIKGAWPRLPATAKSAVMLKGLGYFLSEQDRKFSKDIDAEQLVERLALVVPSELAKRAEDLRSGRPKGAMTGSSPAYLAEAIDYQYQSKPSRGKARSR